MGFCIFWEVSILVVEKRVVFFVFIRFNKEILILGIYFER